MNRDTHTITPTSCAHMKKTKRGTLRSVDAALAFALAMSLPTASTFVLAQPGSGCRAGGRS
eukprot:2745966-Amphidinium_carterae.1